MRIPIVPYAYTSNYPKMTNFPSRTSKPKPVRAPHGVVDIAAISSHWRERGGRRETREKRDGEREFSVWEGRRVL
jgi:hypothetical protein